MGFIDYLKGQPRVPPPDPPELSTATDQIRDLARNLITLEVNTILKDNMVAGPMPSLANALIDIANSYIRAFERLRVDITPVYGIAPGSSDDVWKTAQVVDCRETAQASFFALPARDVSFSHLFTVLRWAALNTRVVCAAQVCEKERVTLQRIEDNSDRIRFVLEADKGRTRLKAGEIHFGDRRIGLCDIETRTDLFVPPPNLTTQERLTIKKIWEVGSEWVVAQTVIQIDGDVVTRIARDFGSQADADKVLALHHRGLDTALARWDSLVSAAVAVVKGLTGSLLRVGP